MQTRHNRLSLPAGRDTMTEDAPELAGYSQREARLWDTIDRYLRLSLEFDRGTLQGHELDELLFTEMRMRQQTRELGLSKRQLELMLAKARKHVLGP